MPIAQTQPHLEIDIEKVRNDFPILHQQVNGNPLVYFDNGATSQKPVQVISAISRYYTEYNSNIHRGVHALSQLATEAYEQSREKVKSFVNAASAREIIFTKGTTDGINLVSNVISHLLKPGKEVLISAMEHHSNIVPWQMACEKSGAKLRWIHMDANGELILDELDSLINENTVIVSVMHVSNALGTINPIEKIIERAKSVSALTLIDGAQAVPHFKVDVQMLDCDFYVFSAHKMLGPTGVGVLYGREQVMEKLPPYQGGGDMIKTVSLEKTTYNELPLRFEAGTPNIEGGIVLAEAIDYMHNLGHDIIEYYEKQLLDYATASLSEIEGLKIYGTAANKAGVISFLIEGCHPYDTGFVLDKMGIAVRTGHHCAQPIMDFFNIPGTVRASFSFYNTFEEVDRLVEGLHKAKKMLL
ncbi:MAG: aminotransferase class V-fold PLP-dependent enzyme [Flavobacteriales bacterium]